MDLKSPSAEDVSNVLQSYQNQVWTSGSPHCLSASRSNLPSVCRALWTRRSRLSWRNTCLTSTGSSIIDAGRRGSSTSNNNLGRLHVLPLQAVQLRQRRGHHAEPEGRRLAVCQKTSGGVSRNTLNKPPTVIIQTFLMRFIAGSAHTPNIRLSPASSSSQ